MWFCFVFVLWVCLFGSDLRCLCAFLFMCFSLRVFVCACLLARCGLVLVWFVLVLAGWFGVGLVWLFVRASLLVYLFVVICMSLSVWPVCLFVSLVGWLFGLVVWFDWFVFVCVWVVLISSFLCSVFCFVCLSVLFCFCSIC